MSPSPASGEKANSIENALYGLQYRINPEWEHQDPGYEKKKDKGASCLITVFITNFTPTEARVELYFPSTVIKVIRRGHGRYLFLHFLPDPFRSAFDELLKLADTLKQLLFA
jgi:hypothetical protein